jgi:hypothetical protein
MSSELDEVPGIWGKKLGNEYRKCFYSSPGVLRMIK